MLAMAERLASFSSTAIVAVSDSLRQEYVSEKLAPSNKVSVIGHGSSNGVAIPPNFERRQTDGHLVVGFVGRIHPDKGLGVLLEAIERLLVKGRQVRLLLVGAEESPGYLASLTSWDSASRPSWIEAVGHVSNPEEYYARMDLLCLPTRREGFPNVVLEAAVHGVPTIASRVTGCVDAIIEGQTGSLFEVGSVDQLASILDHFSQATSDLARLGLAAREHAVAHFDQERVWPEIERFYLHEIARRGAGDE